MQFYCVRQEKSVLEATIVVIYLECRPVLYNFVYIPWNLDITVVRQMRAKKLFVSYFDSTYVSGGVRRVQRPADNDVWRSFHRRRGTYLISRWMVPTEPITYASRGIAGLPPLWVIATRHTVLSRRCSRIRLQRQQCMLLQNASSSSSIIFLMSMRS